MKKTVSAARRKRQRGYTLVAMAMSAIAVVAAMGLTIDLGRIFIAKSETQIYCDAAALAAATRLNGAASGITAAQTEVVATANSWNLDSTSPTSAVLEFSTSAAGPWVVTPPSNSAGYSFARVRLPVQTPLFFLPLVANKFVQDVESVSAAAQVPITSFSVGLAPYTLVASSNAGPNFGLLAGNEYTIQWPQFNGTRNGCSAARPERCFNSPPCRDDPDSARWAVASNWGSNTNGYWGFSANADIVRAIVNGMQTQPISIGQNLLPIMTNGNKAVQATILDQRVNQDNDLSSATPSIYQSSSTHNGRRILLVPVVNPQNNATTTVAGFAAVLLYAHHSPSDYYRNNSNGNDPFCGVYMGPYVVGSPNAGAAISGTGAYRPKLVL